MDSIVININVNLINIKPEYQDPPYITLIDYIFTNKDYVELIYNYYRVGGEYKNDTKLINYKNKLQKNEFSNLLENLKNKYIDFENNPEKYKKMVRKSKKKINKLTNERIYQYIYKGILLNSKFI